MTHSPWHSRGDGRYRVYQREDRALNQSERPLISSRTLRLEISQLIPEERNVSKGKVESYLSTRRHPVLRLTSPLGEQNCTVAGGRGDRARSEHQALTLARKHLGPSTSSNQDHSVKASDAYDGCRVSAPHFPHQEVPGLAQAPKQPLPPALCHSPWRGVPAHPSEEPPCRED